MLYPAFPPSIQHICTTLLWNGVLGSRSSSSYFVFSGANAMENGGYSFFDVLGKGIANFFSSSHGF